MELLAHRRKNTHKSYIGPQKEFFKWSKAEAGEVVNGVTMPDSKKSYITTVAVNPDGSEASLTDIDDPSIDTRRVEIAFVTPEAFDEYQTQYLFHRPQLTTGKGRKQGPLATAEYKAPRPKEGTNVNHGTAVQHRKAMADLHKQQSRLYPRHMDGVQAPNTSPNWAAILATFQKQKAGRRREKYSSRGLQLLGDAAVYSNAQNVLMCEYGIKFGSPRPTGRHSEASGYMVHGMHVLAHSCALRFDDRKCIQLPDLAILDIEGEGPQKTPALIIVMDQGKTNADGKVGMAAAFRHRDNPLCCSHFAVGMMLHYRFTCTNAGFPDFRSIPRGEHQNPIRPWYDQHLFYGYDRSHNPKPTSAISYQTYLNQCNQMLKSCLGETDYGRLQHKTHLERGVSIRMGDMEGLDQESLRKAGRWRGTSAITQSYLTGLSFEYMRFNAGHGREKGSVFVLRNVIQPPPELVVQVFPKVAELRETLSLSEQERGWASCPEDVQFCDLCDYLACVMIQDVAACYDDVKHKRFMAHPPFNTQDFLKFKAELCRAMSDAPANVAMETADAAARRNDRETAGAIRECVAVVRTLQQGSGRAECGGGLPRSTEQQLARIDTNVEQIHTTVVAGNGGSSGTCPEAPPPNYEISDPSSWPTGAALPPFAVSTCFASLSTPEALVTEYLEGLEGTPAIKHLEEVYGPAKRKGQKQGWSWRSGKARGSTRGLDSEFTLRKSAYELVDSVGKETALERMNELTTRNGRGGKATQHQAMKAMLQELASERDGFDERKAQAAVRKRKSPGSATAGEPAPDPPHSPPDSDCEGDGLTSSESAPSPSLVVALLTQGIEPITFQMQQLRAVALSGWSRALACLPCVGAQSLDAASTDSELMPWAKVVASILSHELRSSVVKDAALLIARILLIVAVAARVPWLKWYAFTAAENVFRIVSVVSMLTLATPSMAGILAFVSFGFALIGFKQGAVVFKLAAWLLVVQSNSDRPWMSMQHQRGVYLSADREVGALRAAPACCSRGSPGEGPLPAVLPSPLSYPSLPLDLTNTYTIRILGYVATTPHIIVTF